MKSSNSKPLTKRPETAAPLSHGAPAADSLQPAGVCRGICPADPLSKAYTRYTFINKNKKRKVIK